MIVEKIVEIIVEEDHLKVATGNLIQKKRGTKNIFIEGVKMNFIDSDSAITSLKCNKNIHRSEFQ